MYLFYIFPKKLWQIGPSSEDFMRSLKRQCSHNLEVFRLLRKKGHCQVFDVFIGFSQWLLIDDSWRHLQSLTRQSCVWGVGGELGTMKKHHFMVSIPWAKWCHASFMMVGRKFRHQSVLHPWWFLEKPAKSHSAGIICWNDRVNSSCLITLQPNCTSLRLNCRSRHGRLAEADQMWRFLRIHNPFKLDLLTVFFSYHIPHTHTQSKAQPASIYYSDWLARSSFPYKELL